MPRTDAELAATIRQTISQLSGLLTGGATIRARIEEAEKAAAQSPRKRDADLMVLNSGIDRDEVLMRIREISDDLALSTAPDETPEPGR